MKDALADPLADLAATSAHRGWLAEFQQAQAVFIEALGLMGHALGESDARLLPLLDNPGGLAPQCGRPGKWEHARRAVALRQEPGLGGQ